jgi:hypothetical protein
MIFYDTEINNFGGISNLLPNLLQIKKRPEGRHKL